MGFGILIDKIFVRQELRCSLQSHDLVPDREQLTGEHSRVSGSPSPHGGPQSQLITDQFSRQSFSGDLDHKHHGVLGLVAEGPADDVDGVLVRHSV